MIIGEGDNGEPVEADDEGWLFDDAYGERFGDAMQAIEAEWPPEGYELRFIEEMHVLYDHPAVLFGTMPCTGKSNALMKWHPGEHDVLPASPRKSWARVMFDRIVRDGRKS